MRYANQLAIPILAALITACSSEPEPPLDDKFEKVRSRIEASNSKPKVRSSSNRTSKQNKPSQCQNPASPKSGVEVVFISGYEGSGLSSVALATPDKTSEVARLVIEPGQKPLYIMATSYSPMVWSIEGDTQRVARFVTAPYKSLKEGAGVAVKGLPKEKVEFLDKGCLHQFTDADDSEGIIAKAKWSSLLEREADHVIGHYTINTLKIPSGINTTEALSDRRHTYEKYFRLYDYNPDGLVELDPKTLIAPSPVANYDVFPQEAGIVQLVNSGHLLPLEKRAFKIVKPIARFPAGFSGGHSVKFILGKGVPFPDGNPGHSDVFSEKTGECLVKRC